MYNVNISNWRASGLKNSEVNCIWNHYTFSVSADFVVMLLKNYHFSLKAYLQK